MQIQKLFVLLGFVFLLAVTARANRVTTDYDHTANFSKYKTFMWVHEPDTNEPFMKTRIVDFVNSQLKYRGLRQVSEGADLAIGANVATEEKHTWDTYYSGDGWGWGSGWSTTEMRTYEVGTITVDLFDAQSHKVVWQGVGVDKISTKPEKQTKDTNKQIEKMFRSFPYPH
jgi:Domain of unknown function (DUF4136)